MKTTKNTADIISIPNPAGGFFSGEANGTLYPEVGEPRGRIVHCQVAVAGRPAGEPVTARSFVRTVGRRGVRVVARHRHVHPTDQLGWSRYVWGLRADARARGWVVPAPTPKLWEVHVNPIFREVVL